MRYNFEMFIFDIQDFIGILFGNIEMSWKRLIKYKYFKSLSEKDIPSNTCYCYGGCRACSSSYMCCPYFDRSKLYKIITGCNCNAYCHYTKSGFDFLLSDQCKICGIDEGGYDE